MARRNQITPDDDPAGTRDREAPRPGEQTSRKMGVRSSSEKLASAPRHGFEPIPAARHKAGAFGAGTKKKKSAVSQRPKRRRSA